MSCCKLLLLYGSQQGNSTEIAHIIQNELTQRLQEQSTIDPTQYTIESQCMIDYVNGDVELKNLPCYDILIIVISTTGNGEPPDNASKFLRFLKRRRHESQWLSHTQYGVLGLGDSNYDKFNAMGKTFDELLSKCGGVRFVDTGLADDGIGLELVVEPWKQNLIDTLSNNVLVSIINKHHNVPSEASANTEQNVVNTDTTEHHTKQIAEQIQSLQVDSDSMVVLDQLHNHVIDNESKVRNDAALNIPANLPRLAKCRLRLKFVVHNDSVPHHTLRTYCQSRWHSLDTENVLQGYTPESPCLATLHSARYETTEQCHQQGRIVLHMEIDLPQTTTHRVMYNPGDSIGIYVANDSTTVWKLCERLKVHPNQIIEFTHSKANQAVSDTTAQSVSTYTVPSHYPAQCTIQQAFALSCDITSIPKKAFLRMLAEYCTAVADKHQLYQLCSRDGTAEYTSNILGTKPSLLQLLERYPSCQPPLTHLFALLPPLQPRYYSVSSSPLVHPSRVHFAYSVVQWKSPDQTVHNGVATTYLTQLAYKHKYITPNQYITADTTIDNRDFILPIFVKRSTDFLLPSDLKTPCIMIGPGTGVAPFRAFVQHRSVQRNACASGGTSMGYWRGLELEETDEKSTPHKLHSKYIVDHINDSKSCEIVDDNIVQHHTHITQYTVDQHDNTQSTQVMEPNQANQTTNNDTVYEDIETVCDHVNHHSALNDAGSNSITGSMVLFYGCRGRDLDFIYKHEWDKYVADNTLTGMYTAFSREQQHKVYVQDKIKLHGQYITDLITKHNAYVFICGDGTSMAKDVQSALIQCLQQYSKMSVQDASQYIDKMSQQHRYVTDIWS